MPQHPQAFERQDMVFVGLNELRKDRDNTQGIELPALYEGFRQQGDAGLVVIMRGEIAGWMWMRKGPFSERVGFGIAEIPAGVHVVRYVEVYPPFRSNGVGRSLLVECAKRFRASSEDKAIAFVNSSNAASIRAFDAAGYLQDGRMKFRQIFGRPLKAAVTVGNREES